jgi:hypothetical protein
MIIRPESRLQNGHSGFSVLSTGSLPFNPKIALYHHSTKISCLANAKKPPVRTLLTKAAIASNVTPPAYMLHQHNPLKTVTKTVPSGKTGLS